MERLTELERHGHAYGELHLAVAFTEGLEGLSAKRVRSHGWDKTDPLPDGPYGAALLRGRGERRNPAIVLARSGMFGMDVDGPEGVRLLKQFAPEGLPLTVAVLTGREAGYHLWFLAPEGTSTVFVQLGAEGVQTKTGQYLIAPPAIHSAGRVYRFAEGRAPWEIPMALMPLPILTRIEKASHAERERQTASDKPVTEGGRHDRLMRLGCAMRRRGACLEAVEAALLAENARMCLPPKDAAIVRELARDLHKRYGPEATTTDRRGQP
jgi:hypothetical protein